MGVLACTRNDCDNIMCDTYVEDVGYICSQCEREFKNWCAVKGKKLSSEAKVIKALNKFVQKPKHNRIQDSAVDLDAFFSKYRRN